jgi:plastocyanin
MTRRNTAIVAAVLLAALLSAAVATAARTHRVALVHWGYSPSRVVINRGDSVTWVWSDGHTQHNVYSSSFRSSPIKRSGTWTVRFTRRGTFDYTCTVHPWMSGSVVVR